ncbi:MAG: TetR/AcrR family transcriptional regulator [Candidatus Hodarchaeales archaeon]
MSEKRRITRRNIIVEKAIGLFSQHDYEKVTLSQIAESAGFTKATLYKDYYFGSTNPNHEVKFDVYLAVSATIFQRLCTSFEESLKIAPNGEEIITMGLSLLHLARKNPFYLEVINDPKLRSAVARIVTSDFPSTESEQVFLTYQRKSFELLHEFVKLNIIYLDLNINEDVLDTFNHVLSSTMPGLIFELVIREKTVGQSQRASEDQLHLFSDLLLDGFKFRAR